MSSRIRAAALLVIIASALVVPAGIAAAQDLGAATAGQAGSDGEPFLDRLVTGLEMGLLIALAAVGLSLIFAVTGVVNFAHAELMTFGAVAAVAVEAATPLPFPLVVVVAVSMGGMLGLVLERGLFGPLRRSQRDNSSMMIVSIGVAFILRYGILILLGSRPRSYEAYRIQDEVAIGPVSMPPKDYFIIAASTVVVSIVVVLLGRSERQGIGGRLFGRDAGIDTDRTMSRAWILGASLAAFGGILLGLTTSVEWQLGDPVLLLVLAAVLLGGLGTINGALIGGLAIGVATEISTAWLDKDLTFLVAVVALIGVASVRSQRIPQVTERVS